MLSSFSFSRRSGGPNNSRSNSGLNSSTERRHPAKSNSAHDNWMEGSASSDALSNSDQNRDPNQQVPRVFFECLAIVFVEGVAGGCIVQVGGDPVSARGHRAKQVAQAMPDCAEKCCRETLELRESNKMDLERTRAAHTRIG
jgi:hypothetical protein